jgi:hypothetical protein
MALRLDLACALPHDPTVERLVTAELDEIRWLHQGFRLSCGAFFRESALRVLASSQPRTMQSVSGACVYGEAVTRYVQLLDETPELSSDDVAHDPRLHGLPRSIIGEDTRAMVTLPLRSGARTLGYVRIDAPEGVTITPRALTALRDTRSLCLLAVSLEAELVTSHERSRHILQARRWIHERIEREGEGLEGLRAKIAELSRTIEGTRLDDDARRTLEFAIEDAVQRIAAVEARLDRHAHAAEDAAFFPERSNDGLTHDRRQRAAEKQSENARSTAEKPG